MQNQQDICDFDCQSNGRCLILNYDDLENSQNLDEQTQCQTLLASFLQMGFVCQSMENSLTIDETIHLLKQESNIVCDYKCYVLYILANCNDNGKITCKDGEQISVEQIINCFKDHQKESQSEEIKILFFINSIVSYTKPYYYFVRKGHFCISYNTYPVSWFAQTLTDLHRLCLSKPNFEPLTLLKEINQNIESFNRPEWLEEHETLQSSSEDQLAQQQRLIMLKHGSNSASIDYSPPLLVTSFQKPNEIICSTYDTSYSSWNGRCLILNYVGSKKLVEPQIAQNDVNLVKEMFGSLNFQVEVMNDLSVEETIGVLEKESSSKHSEFGCFILFIIGECQTQVLHGMSEEVIFCKERKKFPLNKLFEYFSEERFPSLKGKPKLFFIEHWDGHFSQQESARKMLRHLSIKTDYLNECHFELPNDFLVLLSARQATVEEHIPNHSLLVHIFYRIFTQFSHKYDLMTLLQMSLTQLNFGINRFLSNEGERNCFLKSNLTKLLFFNFQTLLNYHKLNRYYSFSSLSLNYNSTYSSQFNSEFQCVNISSDQVAIRKCVILDNQNCVKRELNAIGDMFVDFNFQTFQFKNITFSQIDRLAKEEVNLINQQQGGTKYSCLVFCIFADCVNNRGFKSSDGKCVFLSNLIDKFLVNTYMDDATQIFFLINDRSKSANLSNEFFTLQSQTSNVYLSFNTYPDSYFANNLCTILQPYNQQSNLNAEKLLSDLSIDLTNLTDKSKKVPSFTRSTTVEVDNPYSFNIFPKTLTSTFRGFVGRSIPIFPKQESKIVLHDLINICASSLEQENRPQFGPKASQIGKNQFSKTILQLSTNTIQTDKSSLENAYQIKDILFDMQHNRRGRCIIVQFALLEFDRLEKRDDIVKDVQELELTFSGLGFDVESYTIVTIEQFDWLIKREVNEHYWTSDAWVLCLISQFDNGWFHCGGRVVELRTTLQLINKHSKSLPGKPKLVIVHDPYENKLRSYQPIDEIHYLLPDNIIVPDNFALIYSTYNQVNQSNIQPFEDESSFNLVGSCFVQTLCQVLRELSDKYDLITMLRLVTLVRKVGIYSNIYLKSTLQSLVYFKTDSKLSAFNPQAAKYATIQRSLSNMNNIRFNFPIKLFTKGEDLFYNKSKGRCLILRYEQQQPETGNTIKPHLDSIVKEHDIELLENTFKELNFEVDKELNHHANSSYEFLRKEAKRDHQAYSSLVLFIFTNGNPKAVTCREKLVSYFTEHQSLIGKPKLLFIQGLQPMAYPELYSSCDHIDVLETDSNSDSGYKIFRIPKYSDFMLFYSANVSNTVQSLCKVFSETAHQYDLMTLLSMVCEKVAAQTNKSEIPYINSTLTRLVSLSHHQNEESSHLLKYDNSTVAKIVPWENRGKCVIFNYECFDNPTWKQRLGTKVDVETLEKTFLELNFTVDKYNDLSTVDTLIELKDLAKKTFDNIECLVLCFLSHGEDNGVLHCKDGTIYRNDIVKFLNANRTLEGKPKLIFIQACQGKQKDLGHDVMTDSIGSDKFDSIASLPKHPELFIFSRHYSYRNPRHGSWFIQALCHALVLYANEYDLTTIATKVCRIVGYDRQSQDKEKQIPFLYSTLTKPIKLAHKNFGNVSMC